MRPADQAAAMHGVATNTAYSLEDRLQAALQALAWYEQGRMELLQRLCEGCKNGISYERGTDTGAWGEYRKVVKTTNSTHWLAVPFDLCNKCAGIAIKAVKDANS